MAEVQGCRRKVREDPGEGRHLHGKERLQKKPPCPYLHLGLPAPRTGRRPIAGV